MERVWTKSLYNQTMKVGLCMFEARIHRFYGVDYERANLAAVKWQGGNRDIGSCSFLVPLKSKGVSL